jgi:dihydrofolate reductase
MTKDKKEEKKPAPTPQKSKFGNFLLSIILLILGTISASYLSTNTWDFGGQFAKIQRKYLRSQQGKDRVFTAAELAKYDGSDPSKPIYLAIKYELLTQGTCVRC